MVWLRRALALTVVLVIGALHGDVILYLQSQDRPGIAFAQQSRTRASRVNPLPSWAEPLRAQIIQFVTLATDESSPSFVPEEDRIATFDNDGTLWVEKPQSVEVFFMAERVEEMAQAPSWNPTPQLQAVLEYGIDAFDFPKVDIYDIYTATHSGMTLEQFASLAGQFYDTAVHPRWNLPFQALVYEPQLELMNYLRECGFSVFIVSGGGREFMRVVSEDIYGVAKQQVVGTTLQTQFQTDSLALLRTPVLVVPNVVNDGKAISIGRHIGRRPILASGNTTGDTEMLEYTLGNASYPTLTLLVNHDDAVREYSYPDTPFIQAAQAQGVTIVSMKDDWIRIFPFD
jgi:phosphoserine phosphatase